MTLFRSIAFVFIASVLTLQSVHAESTTLETRLNDEKYIAEMSQNLELALAVRVQAVIELGQFSGANALIAIARASRADQYELRLAAIEAVRFWSVKARWDVVSPLIMDDETRVQAAAGDVLVSLWAELNTDQQAYLQPAVDQYVSTLKKIPSGFEVALELANVYRYQQQFIAAEKAYKALIKQYPKQAVGYLQLSELYRQGSEFYRQNNAESLAHETLIQGIAVNPQSAELYYAQGLSYYRQGDFQQAEIELRRAIDNDPNNGRYAYTLAVMINTAQPVEALELYQQAHDNTGSPQYLYALCESYIAQGYVVQATQCIGKLKQVAPDNIVKQLTDKL